MVSFLLKRPFGPRIAPECTQIRKRNHSHGSEVETTRVDAITTADAPRRLDYIELIVWFAFEEKVFLIIFFIAGFLTILISVILWTSVRLTTMLENPPRVRIWSTLLLIVVPPFQGVLLGFIPIFVAQMSMSLLIKFDNSVPRPRRRVDGV